LACGVSVIGSKADGSREALLDGQLGRLVNPKVPKELIEAVTEALTNENRRRRDPAIEFFDIAHFRSRVAGWLKDQARNISATDSTRSIS
jgi:phosphatidylinositol alpha-1,6-mannosyltransferase